jgi:hypothetical protein
LVSQGIGRINRSLGEESAKFTTATNGRNQ